MLTPRVLPVTDPADERLADYVSLTDVALRSRHEPAAGLYIAESSTVLRRALEAGHRPRSVLLAPRWLPEVSEMLAVAPVSGEVPVYVAEEPALEAVTGFHVHRGALAAMHRPALPSVASVLERPRRVAASPDIVNRTNADAPCPAAAPSEVRRVVVFEDVVDHTNLGAGIRACAALGADAFLVTPRCADPLYRRSVRVSMGTVFQLPWTRIDSWPAGITDLRDAGFVVAALALSDEAVELDEFAADLPDRLALVVGTEGDGLKHRTIAAADVVVTIPMSHGVDSLNVASALAVALWATRR